MTFLHWRYPPEAVRALVPAGLELDLHAGEAWVSIAAFEMVDLRLAPLPAAPRLSRFPETNLRTYVRGPGARDAVWFLSLDAASLPVVVGGRAFGVPYHWAAMSLEVGASVRYRSRRRGEPVVGHDLEVMPGARMAATDLDHYLTGRWCAYGRRAGRLTRVEVEHDPWPLHHAQIGRLHQTLTDAAGLPKPLGAPLVHYSPGTDVRLTAPWAAPRWAPRRGPHPLPAG